MDRQNPPPSESHQETLKFDAPRQDGTVTVQARSSRVEVPERLIEGRYQLLKQIGTGGMGVVYLALDRKLDRHVAIKRLIVRSYNARTVQHRFLREAQTIAKLGHYNIVNIYDNGQDEDGHYIVMEYVPGPTLSTKVKPTNPPMPMNLHGYVSGQGPMTVEIASPLMRKVCTALHFAHSRGIIHRDVKPTNILLTPEMEPKLVDFGLARPINLAKSEEITLAGSILGTPEYCAPEQWGDASRVDVRADIYATAGVFWYALSGRSPRYFRENETDPRLAPLLAKGLAAKPDDRFATMQEMIDELDKCLQPVAKPEQKRESESFNQEPLSGTGGFWVCRHCEHSSPDSAKYCIHCGASGLETCANCGTQYRVGAQHCPGCGVDVKMVEESATLLSTAKNHASFYEYETALNYLNEPVRNSNPEARQLYKEWREVILQRRNLTMELDSALRVYNIEKSIEAAVRLKRMVPEECLSESMDFKVAQSFAGMLEELKQMLIEAANRAKQDFNLARFAQCIQMLNRVFGDDICHLINQDLAAIERELDNALTRAGLAAGMNCFTHAQELLETTDPWKGGELGTRRARLMATCKELIEERERFIEETEKAIMEGRFSAALDLVRHMSRFRLPPNNSEINPGAGDREAQDRIIRIDRALMNAIEEHIGEWIRSDDWASITNAVAALKGSESTAWKKLSDKLRGAANQEIVKRYNYAIEQEKRGRMGKAEKAWRIFVSIPQQLAPSNLYQYASEFPARALVYHCKRSADLFRRVVYALGVLWGYFAAVHWWELFLGDNRQPLKLAFVVLAPALAALAISLGLLGVVSLERFHKMELRRITEGRLPRLTILSFIAVLSPLASVVTDLYGALADLVLPDKLPYATYYHLAAIALVWFILDLLRRDGLRFPVRFGFTLSWILTAGIFALVRSDWLNSAYQLQWACMMLTQAALLGGICLLDRKPRQGSGERTPAAPATPPAEAATVDEK